MVYFLSLIALPLLCVAWVLFQAWLARQDPKYQGYQAGCGGCSRSCGESSHGSETKAQFVDASALCSKKLKI